MKKRSNASVMGTAKATSNEKPVESSRLQAMKGVLRGLQQDAETGGADKLPVAEINKEIAAVRREKRKFKRPGA